MGGGAHSPPLFCRAGGCVCVCVAYLLCVEAEGGWGAWTRETRAPSRRVNGAPARRGVVFRVFLAVCPARGGDRPLPQTGHAIHEQDLGEGARQGERAGWCAWTRWEGIFQAGERNLQVDVSGCVVRERERERPLVVAWKNQGRVLHLLGPEEVAHAVEEGPAAPAHQCPDLGRGLAAHGGG